MAHLTFNAPTAGHTLSLLEVSSTGDQTLCVTGIVYPSIWDTQGVTNVQCWLSWDGGNWNATRCI